MYQSVYYNRIPGDDQYHYYLRDDKKGINCFQYYPTLYKLDEYGEHKNLFGETCSPFKGKYDWKSHKEIAEKLDKNTKEELSSMLGKNWIDVPIEDINNMIRQFDKELLRHSIETSVAAFNNIK